MNTVTRPITTVVLVEYRVAISEEAFDHQALHIASDWKAAEDWMRNNKDFGWDGNPWWWYAIETAVDHPGVTYSFPKIYYPDATPAKSEVEFLQRFRKAE